MTWRIAVSIMKHRFFCNTRGSSPRPEGERLRHTRQPPSLHDRAHVSDARVEVCEHVLASFVKEHLRLVGSVVCSRVDVSDRAEKEL